MATAVTSYYVDAQTGASGMGTIRTKATDLAFDASPGQGDALPGPADLLTAAFAACMLKNVQRMAELMPFSFSTARIAVDAHRQDSPPRMDRIHYRLEVTTDEPPERVERLHRNVRKYGTITNTLAAACEVDGEVVVVPPPTTTP